MYRGNSDWVDIDNDGLLDIFLIGFNESKSIIIKSYKNIQNDDFIEVDITSIESIPGSTVNAGVNSARWADLDGDGLKDVVIAQSTSEDFVLEVYKNLGNFSFEKQNVGLPKLSYVAMELGDVNNDNLIDIIFTGSPNLSNNTGDGTGDFYVYTNNGNMNFVNSFTIADEGVFKNDIELADINNDGFLDVMNFGTGPWGTFSEIAVLYLNDKDGTFSYFPHTLPDCRSGGLKFGDFDNDDDMDILYYGRITDPRSNEIAYIYENDLLNKDIPSEIIFNQSCICDNSLEFKLDNTSDTVIWDFDDPSSGILNTSNDKRPTHNFSAPGNYLVKATFTLGTITKTLTEAINIVEIPDLDDLDDIILCSSNAQTIEHDLSSVMDSTYLENYNINFYSSYENASNNQYKLALPYISNIGNETIYVRIESKIN